MGNELNSPNEPDVAEEGGEPSCGGPACGCSVDVATPPPPADPNLRLFAVQGMDCSEEVGALRREVGPVVGGESRLSFDLLAGQMGVAASRNDVSDEEIVASIRKAGLVGAPMRDGEVEAEASWWQSYGRTAMTAASAG